MPFFSTIRFIEAASNVSLPFPAIVATPDLNYTALYEISDSTLFGSEEILEIFSKQSKLLIAVDTARGSTVKTWSDYSNDELTAVFGFGTPQARCEVMSLRENLELTPWLLDSDASGNEIPVSPLSYLFNKAGYVNVWPLLCLNYRNFV